MPCLPVALSSPSRTRLLDAVRPQAASEDQWISPQATRVRHRPDPNAHRSQTLPRFTPPYVSESTGRSPEFPRLPILSTLTYMSFSHIIFHNISFPRIAYPGEGSDNVGERGLVSAEKSEQIGDDRSVRLRIRMQRSCDPKAMIHRRTWTAFFRHLSRRRVARYAAKYRHAVAVRLCSLQP
jgi:hypothetical protein